MYERAKSDVKPDENTIFISDNQPKDSERRKILTAISQLLQNDKTVVTATGEIKDEVDDKSIQEGTEPCPAGAGIFPGVEADNVDANLIESVVPEITRPPTPCLDCRDLR